MDQKVLMAALAGLLHDVGKFAQRGAERGSLEGKDAAQMYGRYHAMLTADFLKTCLPLDESVRLPAANHHSPQSRADWLVKAADVLSAGERADLPKGEDTRIAQPRQLLSIFSIVEADKVCWKEENDNWRFLPLNPLALDMGNIFPEPPLPDADVWKIYESMWVDFKKEANGLNDIQEMDVYLEAVLGLLQRYTWCMPSAYYNARPDISLYDHSRMTAALAAVLANESEFPQAQLEKLTKDPEHNEDEIALLIGGDISGVQDFIYTITNKGATSALRGRSFYLQLLTEAAARFVLRELGLPYTNLIYGGGGNFYILARAKDKAKLDDLRQKLSRILYKHHQGDLYIAIAGQELKASDFMRPANGKHPLSSKWGELARELAQVKNQRFSELTEKELAVLFEPQGHGGNEDEECQVCGREHPKTEEVNKKQNGEGVRECPACQSYEALGKSLRNAKYIGWNLIPHPNAAQSLTAQIVSAGWEEALQDLGFRVKPTEKFDFPASKQRIWALSDDALASAPKASGHILIRRLMVNTTPRLDDDFESSDGQQFKKGDIKPFEKLVDESTGIKRLGVLRMDVDNLGKLFESGLGSDATLSRIAALSSAIGLYFEGWVGKLAEKHQDKVYAIYSGGDDLFFVGAWNEIAELAREIRGDLPKYAANHPGIHASGGIILVNEKYPLAKAAEEAGRAEEQAKSLKWWNEAGDEREKDALCFLGQPLQWARVGLSDNADNLNTSYGLMLHLKGLDNQSLVRTLLRHYEQYADAEASRRQEGADLGKNERPQTLYGPWNWRILYTLKRNLKSETKLAEKFNADPAMMEWIGLAARWAELITR